MNKLLFSFVIVSLFFLFFDELYSQVDTTSKPTTTRFWCGTIDDAPKSIQRYPVDQEKWKVLALRILSESPKIIPIAFHLIKNSSNQGGISNEEINNQILILNQKFGSMNISFSLSSVDETINDLWFDDLYGYESEMKNELAINPLQTLNIYTGGTVTASNLAVTGRSTYPWAYDETSKMHGILFNYLYVPTEDVVHEIGHILGLYHTFEDECVNGYNFGDYCQDTPAQRDSENVFECIDTLDTCTDDPGNDPVHNYMNYSGEGCWTHFTTDQIARVLWAFATYKSSMWNGRLTNVSSDRLVLNQWSILKISTHIQESGEYYVGIWNSSGLWTPGWEWADDYTPLSPNIGSQVFQVNAPNDFEFLFNVKPTDQEEDFYIWLYRKDSWGLFPVIDKLSVTVSTSSINIISPAENDNWLVNELENVEWNSVNLTGNVNILLSTDGGSTFPITLISNTPNDGNQQVTVPNFLSTNCKLKIESSGNPEIFGLNSGNFIISSYSLALVSPNNGEQLHKGNTYLIEWACQGYNGNFNIKLKKGNGIHSVLAQNISGRQYEWTIASNLPTGVDYKILVESVDATLSDESDNYFSILEATTGHDLALVDPSLNRSWLTPGQDLGFKFYVKNLGVYTENNYSIKYNLKNSVGSILAQGETSGVTLVPNETSTQFSRTLPLDPLPEGFYTFNINVFLSNDSYQSNNSASMTVYIGNEDPFTTFRYSNTAVITAGNTQTLDGYAVKFINGNVNEIRVNVYKQDVINETRWIEDSTIARFDANRFFLSFININNGNQAVLEYGSYSDDISFLQKDITVEAGTKGYYDLHFNGTPQTSDENHLYQGGEDYPTVSNWGIKLDDSPFPTHNLRFSINVPLTADYKKNNYWVELIINDQSYYQRLSVTVIAPQPDFTYSLSKSNVTLAPNLTDQITVSLQPKNGFNESVSLGISDLPSFVTANFTPSSIVPPGSINVSFSVIGTNFTPGFYTGTINFFSSTRFKSMPIFVDILDNSSKYIQILSTTYLDLDNRNDSLSVKYNSVFNNASVGLTTEWKYTLDGTNFIDVPEFDIYNNHTKPQGIDSILWKVPTGSTLYSTNAQFQMRQKAGLDLFTLLKDNGNLASADIYSSCYVDGYLYVINDEVPQYRKYTYSNNNFTLISTGNLSIPVNFGNLLVYCNGRFYLWDDGDEIVYIFNSSFGLIGSKTLNNDYKTLFVRNNVLYAYYKQSASVYYLLELDANVNPTGNSLPISNSIPEVTTTFYDGKNLWSGGTNNLYKISSDLQSYTQYPVTTRMYTVCYAGDYLLGCGNGSNSTLIALNFKDPLSLPSTSQTFLLNNTYKPDIKNISPISLNENSQLIGGLDLDTIVVDPDTPLNQITISVQSNQSENIIVVKDQADPTLINFYPALNWNGNFTYTISASDGFGSTEKVLSGSVIAVNNAPQISGIPDKLMEEDQYWTFDLDDYMNDVDNANAELDIIANVIFTSLGVQLKPYPVKNNSKELLECNMVIDKGIKSEDGVFQSKMNTSLESSTNESESRWDNPLSGNLELLIDTLTHVVVLRGSENYYADSILVEFKVTDPSGAFDTDTIYIKILQVNDPPTIFSRLTPLDSSVTAFNTQIFSWTSSDDIEGENIEYKFIYRIGTVDSVSFTQDSTITINLSYLNSIADSMRVTWVALASDGQHTTYPSNGTGTFFFSPPTKLKWTSEPGCESDGVNPDTGSVNTTFTFRVTYIDQFTIAPSTGYPKLHILKNDIEILGSPFTMLEANSNPFVTGRIYTLSKDSLEESSYYSYYFEAVNQSGWEAKGEATYENGGPVVILANNFQLSINLINGWNMTSVPGLHPTNQNVNTWWTNRNPLADVYKWNGAYTPVTLTDPTEGYWMLHTGDQTYNTGDEWPAGGIQIVAHDPIPVINGWNMIGGYEASIPVSGLTTTPPGIIVPNTIYGWNGTYYNATDLVPGYGYWVLINGGPGVINVPTLIDGSGTIAKEEDRSQWGKITLTDANGKSYTLYSVNGEVNLDHYQMPPLPPTGSFDVRYSSNRKAENLKEGNQVIEMRGLVYPVTVRVENGNIKLQDETGKTVNSRLKSGEEITINNSQVSKLIVSENIIPDVYSLEQNYPNPFNPSTVIRFSLPEDVENVRITIYNALGQRVTELVNTKVQAGQYEYRWDARDVASGLYFYTMRTGDFIQTKKMLLIK